MAGSPKRHTFTDSNQQKIVAIVPFITHLKEAGPSRTQVFMVGGDSFTAQGAVLELEATLWP